MIDEGRQRELYLTDLCQRILEDFKICGNKRRPAGMSIISLGFVLV